MDEFRAFNGNPGAAIRDLSPTDDSFIGDDDQQLRTAEKSYSTLVVADGGSAEPPCKRTKYAFYNDDTRQNKTTFNISTNCHLKSPIKGNFSTLITNLNNPLQLNSKKIEISVLSTVPDRQPQPITSSDSSKSKKVSTNQLLSRKPELFPNIKKIDPNYLTQKIEKEKSSASKRKSLAMSKKSLKALEDMSSTSNNTSSFSAAETVSINSISHLELKQILKDSGALGEDGKLHKIPAAALTIKLVLAAVNVFNFSAQEICMWVIKSCKTKYLDFNEKFNKQFQVYKVLYELIRVNIKQPNGQELLRIIGETRYNTPIKMSSWYIIFNPIPYLLDAVALSSSIQEQSKALNMVHISRVSRTAIRIETASKATVSRSKTGALCDDSTYEKGTDTSLDVTTDLEDIKAENVNDMLMEKKNRPDCPCTQSTLTLEAVKQFLTKIEASMSIQIVELVNECDVKQRMTRIEEHLALEKKAKHSEGRHQILSQTNQEELHFKMNVLQLQKTIKYVQSKDHNNNHNFRKRDTLKENVMHLNNCYKAKSKKISFLRSQVYLLENILNHCMHQMLRQKRVNEIIRAKLVSLEKCYFSQRSLLLQRQKCVNRMPTHESSTQTGGSLDSSMSTAVVPYGNFGSSYFRMFPPPATMHQSTHYAPTGDYPYCYYNRGSAGFPGNYQAIPLMYQTSVERFQRFSRWNNADIKPKCNSVALQCELIFEQYAVLKIPPLVTANEVNMAEIIAVQDSIVAAANETSKSISGIVSDHTAALFKCVLERMILYELMLDNKAFLDISLPTSSSVCVFRPCDVYPDKDYAPKNKSPRKCSNHSVVLNDGNKNNCSSKQAKTVELINENCSVNNFRPVMALVKNPDLWTELSEQNVNQLINDLFSFLINTNKESLISTPSKQKIMNLLNNEPLEEMTKLCLKIERNHGNCLRQLNVINDSFNNVCIVKMEKVEHQFSQLEAYVRKYEMQLMKNKNTIAKFSETVIHSTNEIKLLEDKLTHFSERDNFLFGKLNSVYLILHETLSSVCLDKNDVSITTFPSLEVNITDSLLELKVSSIFNLITKLKKEIEKCKDDKSLHANLLSSCHILGSAFKSSQEKQNKIEIAQKKMKDRVDEMINIQDTVQKLQEQNHVYKQEIVELKMNVNYARHKLSTMISMKQQEVVNKNHTEYIESKLEDCIVEIDKKKLELEVLTGLLIKERTNTLDLQIKLNESSIEIDKLVLLWEVLELSNKGPQVDRHQYKSLVEQRGLGSVNMSMLEHITGWKPQQSNLPVNNSSGSSSSYECSSYERIPTVTSTGINDTHDNTPL